MAERDGGILDIEVLKEHVAEEQRRQDATFRETLAALELEIPQETVVVPPRVTSAFDEVLASAMPAPSTPAPNEPPARGFVTRG